MQLLEIKNNLVKLAYVETERPVLGRFIVLSGEPRSYVAQLVNLKSDAVNKFAIAKLLFTFTEDGLVDDYDGSMPDISAEIEYLQTEELINLLPVETPIKIGKLSQQVESLSLDISVFEQNFTVFVEKDIHKETFISNCVRQLFQLKEKSVIIDLNNIFEDYSKIEICEDFKLPLNSRMIDYIFEHELKEVDATTKAIIQDIFYEVQQYIKELDFEFLPIDNFVDVVAAQYKTTQMPELALLKNKLLKYRDANIFANTKEEVFALKAKLNEKNCSIISLLDIGESLQKEAISFIHDTLLEFEKYVYFFVSLTDDNSDKKLLKQLINNNHVFSTIFVPHSYKYAQDLKQYAQNLILFAPKDANHDFAAYNTFLNKLNQDECIVYGRLTQGIPFITDMTDLELDLTKDDVLGDKNEFIPLDDEIQTEQAEQVSQPAQNTQVQEPVEEITPTIPEIPQTPIELVDSPEPVPVSQPEVEILQKETLPEPTPSVIEPTTNILSDEDENQEIEEEEEELSLPEQDLEIDEEDFSDFDEEDLLEETMSVVDEAPLTEDDLNFLEENQIVEDNMITEPNDESEDVEYQESPYIQEDQPPVVPIYPAEENAPEDETECKFKQGDSVTHPRYGRGVIEKIIKYGNKTLCSISFENVGRRLLDPTISELTLL
jgi:hypothetical protein